MTPRTISDPQPGGKITAPGIYDLPADVYHADPCAAPSIGSSGLRMLLNECPAKFWHQHINPERERFDKDVWRIGRAAHTLLLQPDHFHAEIHVLSEDCNLRTNDGKAERDEAIKAGKTVIRHDDFLAIANMVDALKAHDIAGASFVNGQPERSLFWQDEETGVWLRCRPDFLPTALRHIPDYKTAASAKPAKFIRAAYDFGYHMQAAHYLDGIEAVTGRRPDSFYFVVQEKTAPYIVTCLTLDPGAIEWGQIQNRKAIHLFADCLASDHWPGYEADVVEMPLPGYAEAELMRQDTAGKFTIDQGEAA